MTVHILGSQGMLGRYITLYMKKFYNVREFNRPEFDAKDVSSIDYIEHFVNTGDIVINGVGVIKHIRPDKHADINAILINSAFPRLLANMCEEKKVKMIHPSTDCVFDGLLPFTRRYYETDESNAIDVYGKTKFLGEPPNCTVIRTSIIGEEIKQQKSLIEWVKKNANGEINGYINHRWNGVTCYQFAKICHEIINKNLFWNGVKHVFSGDINKYDLVKIINSVFDLRIKVNPVAAPINCNRMLSSVYDMGFKQPIIIEQILELKEIHDELYGDQSSI